MYEPNNRAPKIMTQKLQTNSLCDYRHRYPQQNTSKQNPVICGNAYIPFKALHGNVHKSVNCDNNCGKN